MCLKIKDKRKLDNKIRAPANVNKYTIENSKIKNYKNAMLKVCKK